MKYPRTVRHHNTNFLGRIINYKDGTAIIVYKNTSVRKASRHTTIGRIKLPYGWQDMDRTWTSQDIYWEDKIDYEHAHGRAMQLESKELLIHK